MRFLLSRGNWRAAAASLADDGKFRREGRDGSTRQRPRTSEFSPITLVPIGDELSKRRSPSVKNRCLRNVLNLHN